MTLIENMVAMVVLGAAMVAVAQLVANIAVQRNVAERDAVARQEAANQMERVFALPWKELGQDSAAQLQLSDVCLQRLSEPELNVTVGPPGGEPLQRRIQVEVSWRDVSGQYRRSASLAAWRYEIKRTEE